MFFRFPSDYFALATECWIKCLIWHGAFCRRLSFVGGLFLNVRRGPQSSWRPGGPLGPSVIVPAVTSVVLGQGSGAVRSRCHTLSAGGTWPAHGTARGPKRPGGTLLISKDAYLGLFSNRLHLTAFVFGRRGGLRRNYPNNTMGTFVGSLKRRSYRRAHCVSFQAPEPWEEQLVHVECHQKVTRIFSIVKFLTQKILCPLFYY